MAQFKDPNLPKLLTEIALFDYLLQTKDWPGILFGSSEVDDIGHHLDGWWAHRRLSEDGDGSAQSLIGKFHIFVMQGYCCNRTISWNRLKRENTTTDEEGFQTLITSLRLFTSGVRQIPEQAVVPAGQ